MSSVDLTEKGLSIIDKVAVKGNLKLLKPDEMLEFYVQLCTDMQVNPYTKPFDFIEMPVKGGGFKMVPYANKDCTDQLRRKHNISVKITSRELMGDIYVVTAQATDSFGRSDESMGVVSLSGSRKDGSAYVLSGDAKANKFMHAETKAKRRATLSLVGLGMLDESELHSINNAKAFSIDLSTGEVLDKPIEGAKQDFLPKEEAPQVAPIQYISEAQVMNLSKMVFDIKMDNATFFKKCKIADFKMLPLDKYETTMQWLQMKLDEKNKPQPTAADYMSV